MNYKIIIKESVYEKLKKKVRGKVSCRVEDDTLHIKVLMVNTIYKMEVSNLSDRIRKGLNSDVIVDDFCKGYRNYILKGYFR